MCVCSLSCPYAMHMCHIVICGLYNNFFPHYLTNGTILEKTLLNTKCVFWFSVQLLSETCFILRRNERDIIKNVYQSSCKVPDIFIGFEWNLSFLHRSSKHTQISNFTKIRPVGSQLFHADGRTDMAMLTVAFHNFVNLSKIKKKKLFMSNNYFF